jgi:hypothetical protein
MWTLNRTAFWVINEILRFFRVAVLTSQVIIVMLDDHSGKNSTGRYRFLYICWYLPKGKGKVRPVTGKEGPEWE